MRCRPAGTATFAPVRVPSSSTFVAGGSAARVICAGLSVATAIVERGNGASPARATSTVRAATPVSVSVR